jgi:NADP-dependent 3-hydroxy acid dehydrogenase YdfG
MCYLLRVTGLRDKVVLVTGASRGIGEALAVEFAPAGAVVVVSSRNEEKLQPLAQRLKSGDGQALALRCDVANRKQVAALDAMIAGRDGLELENALRLEAAGCMETADFKEGYRAFVEKRSPVFNRS